MLLPKQSVVPNYVEKYLGSTISQGLKFGISIDFISQIVKSCECTLIKDCGGKQNKVNDDKSWKNGKSYEKSSISQTTSAALSVKPLPQTVPHVSLWSISKRPRLSSSESPANLTLTT